MSNRWNNPPCETCRFWEPFSKQADDRPPMGECRNHSPRVFQAHDGKLISKWPTKTNVEWCGDHKPIPPEKP